MAEIEDESLLEPYVLQGFPELILQLRFLGGCMSSMSWTAKIYQNHIYEISSHHKQMETATFPYCFLLKSRLSYLLLCFRIWGLFKGLLLYSLPWIVLGIYAFTPVPHGDIKAKLKVCSFPQTLSGHSLAWLLPCVWAFAFLSFWENLLWFTLLLVSTQWYV